MFDSALPMGSRHLIALRQTAEYLLQQVNGASQTRKWEKLASACRRLLNLDEADLPDLCVEAEALLKAVDLTAKLLVMWSPCFLSQTDIYLPDDSLRARMR